MGFTIYRAGDLNANERIVAFYKKELHASHIIAKARRDKHYNTKEARKQKFDFPSKRRYQRTKAIISNAYIQKRRTYSQMADLGKKI